MNESELNLEEIIIEIDGNFYTTSTDYDHSHLVNFLREWVDAEDLVPIRSYEVRGENVGA